MTILEHTPPPKGIMNPEQPGGPEGDMTIRRRWDGPAPPPPRRQATPPHPLPPPANAAPLFPQPPRMPPLEDNRTQRLDYTPDLLPDVAYETRKSRSGWWWLFAVGGVLLLVVALAAAVLLSANS
ncbi:hypothetical protein GCM10023096_84300 [Nonomuraea ferruginea]